MNKVRQELKRTEDPSLIAAYVNQSDEAAFATLVRKYESLVWSTCCRLLHNRCDAEDAFQATFLLLATRARRIRKPKSLSSWLYGVAFRTASSIRRQRQREATSMEHILDGHFPEDVLALVAQRNENELVSAELMLMKERYKTPLLMFYFLGCTTKEISKTLGLSITATESRLKRAKLNLKNRLRLRGVGFDRQCMGLVIPVLAMSPGLSLKTIESVAAASVTTGAHWVTDLFSFIPQSGAKIMMLKFACSISLLCVVSVGLLGHGAVGLPSGLIQIEEGDQQPQAAAAIKFVHNDEDENWVAEKFHAVHDHVYGVWKGWTKQLFGSTNQNDGVIVVVELADLEQGSEVNKFRLIGKLSNEIDASVVDLSWQDAESNMIVELDEQAGFKLRQTLQPLPSAEKQLQHELNHALLDEADGEPNAPVDKVFIGVEYIPEETTKESDKK